ncbi:hypothetical protein EV715DRAFT_200658, partial [Schizophyllum commune]
PHHHVLGHCLHHLPHYRPSTPPPDPPLGSRPHLACTISISFSFSPPLLCLVSSSPATSPLCIEFRTPRYLSTISLRYHALLTLPSHHLLARTHFADLTYPLGEDSLSPACEPMLVWPLLAIYVSGLRAAGLCLCSLACFRLGGG